MKTPTAVVRLISIILRDRIERLKLEQERAQAALDRVPAHNLPATEIPLEMIERFGREMRVSIGVQIWG